MKLPPDGTVDLANWADEFGYSPDITRKLDALDERPFDQAVINEIILWKSSRHAPMAPEALAALNALAHTQPGKHAAARDALALLMDQRGVDLPMASTLLRFRNPGAFQIIDQRTYKALTGEAFPYRGTTTSKIKIDFYFAYLDKLIAFAAAHRIDFEMADRVLYVVGKANKNTRRPLLGPAKPLDWNA